jgi:hypothetical protein
VRNKTLLFGNALILNQNKFMQSNTTTTNLSASLPKSQADFPVYDKSRSSISWENFQKRFLNRADGFQYEWVGGQVVKSKHMDKLQLLIVKKLLALFRS